MQVKGQKWNHLDESGLWEEQAVGPMGWSPLGCLIGPHSHPQTAESTVRMRGAGRNPHFPPATVALKKPHPSTALGTVLPRKNEGTEQKSRLDGTRLHMVNPVLPDTPYGHLSSPSVTPNTGTCSSPLQKRISYFLLLWRSLALSRVYFSLLSLPFFSTPK